MTPILPHINWTTSSDSTGFNKKWDFHSFCSKRHIHMKYLHLGKKNLCGAEKLIKYWNKKEQTLSGYSGG